MAVLLIFAPKELSLAEGGVSPKPQKWTIAEEVK